MPDGDGNLRGVVLKSYFDGGNQADSRSYDVVSLSVVSGTRDEWMPFEKDWNRVLAEHGADYLHTTDAVSRQGIFRGWTEKKVDSFLRSCVRAACKHCARYSRRNDRGKFGLLPFVASVVLKDFVERAKADRFASQNANEACLRQALGEVLLWSENQAACKQCHLFFDQGEPYYGHLCQLLQNKKALKSAWLLNKITQKSEADMRVTPGLQLADLYAWSQCNRLSEWNPIWRQKLLRSHFRWQWIDRTNIHDVNQDHQTEWLRWNLPRRAWKAEMRVRPSGAFANATASEPAEHTATARKAVSPSGIVLVLRSSKALQFECETSPPPAHVLRIAPSGLVDHDGVLGGTRVCGVSTVPASAFTLLPATRKQ